MKRYIYIIVCFIVAAAVSMNIASAENRKDKALCFVYVAESDATSVGELAGYLEARYRKAIADEDYVLVMYLSNGNEPVVVEVNTESDNRETFAGFMEDIRENMTHKVDPEYDLRRLTAMFERLDFISQTEEDVKYGSVDWHFHVTSDFWKQGYNESLISPLCFVMGVDHLENANFRLRCYFSRYDDLEYDEEYPFGKKNYCNLEFRPYYY